MNDEDIRTRIIKAIQDRCGEMESLDRLETYDLIRIVVGLDSSWYDEMIQWVEGR